MLRAEPACVRGLRGKAANVFFGSLSLVRWFVSVLVIRKGLPRSVTDSDSDLRGQIRLHKLFTLQTSLASVLRTNTRVYVELFASVFSWPKVGVVSSRVVPIIY